MGASSADHDVEGWHPVRVAVPRQRFRLPGAAAKLRDPKPMIRWCEKEVRTPWKAIMEVDGTPVFYFRDSADAARFALRFFPIECG